MLAVPSVAYCASTAEAKSLITMNWNIAHGHQEFLPQVAAKIERIGPEVLCMEALAEPLRETPMRPGRVSAAGSTSSTSTSSTSSTSGTTLVDDTRCIE